ncbi:hypothetical protein PUW24_05705 [Paenibacillus urinalis]|uniref:Uncharacterized protein n=1 Tax=Paenibacillus urinalis TaxID=521520 RepID=A0AAX3N0Y1_9BACL|nr:MULTISPECIES: hypothetical protein [Paenibacillus]WDH82365.1 hypothetical protein PUW23_23445 [Paenibacillus urinalis]WDH98421.1 hypothetical protein PUW24_05705 [Paenibacillus urinalis]WDI02111.1 hypothetical protein PUW25_23430 [Paenibacillus urinalis]GAK41385.1 hypothetical protein TCA2_3876 [Paenibacillus sp. TCA20]
MHVPVIYEHWSESDKKVIEPLTQLHVSQEELFVRKLVNATIIRGELYEHTANESEDGHRHLIYAKKFNPEDYSYGKALYEAAFDAYQVSSGSIACEYVLWKGRSFQSFELNIPLSSTMDIARLLLDHYLVHRDETYESVYTVFDTDRSKVVLYLKRGEF